MQSRSRRSPEIDSEQPACPLCCAPGVSKFFAGKQRDYLHCPVCGLVFVPPTQFLSAEEEKKRYDLHQNSPDDDGYRRFLGRLFIPLKQRLERGSSGLDFGSGPEPTLSLMLEDAGHPMAIFDLFYNNVPAALNEQYDFITTTEVVEHLREPRRELDRLWACLKRGGWLGIMTKFAVDRTAFPRWYYKDDPTHICFFSRSAFAFLAAAWNADLIIPEDDVVLIQKR